MGEFVKVVLYVHYPPPEVVNGSKAHVSKASFSSSVCHDASLLNIRGETTCVIESFSFLGLILNRLFSFVLLRRQCML